MDLDRRLIADCLRGRTDAFGELVLRYESRLYYPVRRLVGCEEDAKDVIQETFLLAYQSLAKFQGDSTFFTWLHRIAVNRAISFKRKQRTYRTVEANSCEQARSSPLYRTEENEAELALGVADLKVQLHRALQRMSASDRAVVVMRDLESQTYETIARKLQVPMGTIRSRLHRARKELRGILLSDNGRPPVSSLEASGFAMPV